MAGRLRARRGDHSSGTLIAERLKQPTRTTRPTDRPRRACAPASFLFGFAPGGACLATDVAASAVRSYRTLSPLPSAEASGGLLSVALSLGSPPPDVIRRRVRMEPGLSSVRENSGRPANWRAGFTQAAKLRSSGGRISRMPWRSDMRGIVLFFLAIDNKSRFALMGIHL